MTIDQIMRMAPVIPIIVGDQQIAPEAIAETLVEAGLSVIEVTLRSDSALGTIKAMAQVPGAIVGAGTVLNPDQWRAAEDAGASFIVSPGLTEQLAEHARGSAVPFLPGVATASELMRGLEHGFGRFKFFPAVPSGGPALLKSLSEPMAAARFCPTGGIRPETAGEWLAMDPVLCVGGTWIVRAANTDVGLVAERAREAAALRTVG